MRSRPHLLLLPLAGLALLTGIGTGLARMGLNVPVSAAAEHGALMVGSFLGTLIAVERAVAVRRRWVLLVPAVNALSLAFFLGNEPRLGLLCLLLGSLGQAGITYFFMARYPEVHFRLLFAGAVCLLVGHGLLWRTGFYPVAVPWYVGFLLLTIAAERLELSRFLPVTSRQKAGLWAALGAFAVGLLLPFHGWGRNLTGLGMLGVAAWLLRFDMAFKSVRKTGQTRHTGAVLLLGYGWLVVSGLLWLWPTEAPFWYDAALHAFFLGFVFSMVFAHAPVIFPGILGRRVPLYHPVLYGWAGLNAAALLFRLLADALERPDWRAWSGLAQGAALVLFFGTVAVRFAAWKRVGVA